MHEALMVKSKVEADGDVILIPPPGVTRQGRSQSGSRRVVPTADDLTTINTRSTLESKEAREIKRGNNLGRVSIPPMEIMLTSRELTIVKTGNGEVEIVLANGDLYMGGFGEDQPNGNGKYLWADGCMYEGEWRVGKASGRGKFSWPSGATYEGEFRDGRMEGKGTFIGADGDTYRGLWAADRKHGFGEKRYANGDVYTGLWKWNVQDGEGRYVWSNGNEYVGEWKNGVMFGKGVFVWTNGKRYEGDWVDGAPKGNGVFTWPDDEIRGKSGGNHGRARRAAIGENNGNGNFSKICIWDSDGEAGDITCDIIGSIDSKLMLLDREVDRMRSRKSPQRYEGPEMKKCGQVVVKGHKNYDLILSFQLGIRYTIGKHAAIAHELRQDDFDPYEKFWTRFSPEGSKVTPAHQSPDFKWKDYCPMVFKHLRELFRIDPAEYMVAICGSDALRELSSPGKSGSLFFLTQDDRFIIKTVRKAEVKVLLRMLPHYYEHISNCKNSLVTKFFGVHCVKPIGGQKTRFVVMGNVFYSEYGIHKRFDLKGSSYGRMTGKPEGETDETTTFKDLDLDFVFNLRKSWYEELIRLITNDCLFLEAENIMDYSLLIGVHFCNTKESFIETSGEINGQDYQLALVVNQTLQNQQMQSVLGRNIPGKAVRISKIESNITSNNESQLSCIQNDGETYDVILYLGIIDILQDYDITKKLEHAYKSLQVDANSISAVDPKQYSKRFRDFIHKIFVEDEG
ncbi:hypothetical protein Leryth_002052 [Lithospermum erythrorhizon]|nr:hypothetical protein Leryth_002052 [Lithospermum erythrorhizon]